jgi:hypothetical protein
MGCYAEVHVLRTLDVGRFYILLMCTSQSSDYCAVEMLIRCTSLLTAWRGTNGVLTLLTVDLAH